MKKLFTLLLALMMCLTLAACGGKPVEPDVPDVPAPPENVQTNDENNQQNTDNGAADIRINNENWQEYLEFVYSDVPFFTYDNGSITYGFYTALVLKDEYLSQMDYENAFSQADLEQMNNFEFLVGGADENKSPIFFDGTLQLGTAPILSNDTYQIDLDAAKDDLRPSDAHTFSAFRKCQINGKDAYAAFFGTPESKLVNGSTSFTETSVYWGNPIDDSMFYGVLKLK